MSPATPTHRLWIKHPVAFNAQQRAAALHMLRLCHVVPEPSAWESHHAGGITFDHLAVSGATQDVARAAQIIQALQQFVYLSVPPISIGEPAHGFPLPEVTLYRYSTQPGWAQEVETDDLAMYTIGRCAYGLVVECYPTATLLHSSIVGTALAASPEAAVAAWVQATREQWPRVIVAEPCAPSLWRFAYQI